jgi:hypothetical protein
MKYEWRCELYAKLWPKNFTEAVHMGVEKDLKEM